MSKSKGSPRKFSEKIALLNKKEAESNAEFEKIIKEVEETTRVPPVLSYSPTLNEVHRPQPCSNYGGQQQSPMWTQSSSSNDFHQSNLEQPTIDTTTGGIPYFEEQQLPMLDSFQQLVSPQMVQQQITTTDGLNDYGAHETLTTNQHQIVPNIKIFPIGDDQPQSQQYQQQQLSQQQQVSPQQNPQHHHPLHHHHHHHHQISSNYPLISSARSLPDIASLRVSGSFSSIGSAYSDQRLPQTTTANDNNNQYQYQSTYDANSNLVKPPSSQYLPSTLEHQVWQQQQSGYYPSEPLADDNFGCTQAQMIPIARASSTQACWPAATTSNTTATTTTTATNGNQEFGNGLGANLEAPPATSLSRSAEGFYGSYMESHQQTAEPQMACYGSADSNQGGNQQTTTPSIVHGHRFRSSSYNSLGQMQVSYQTNGAGVGIQHPNQFAKSPTQFYG